MPLGTCVPIALGGTVPKPPWVSLKPLLMPPSERCTPSLWQPRLETEGGQPQCHIVTVPVLARSTSRRAGVSFTPGVATAQPYRPMSSRAGCVQLATALHPIG